MKNSQTIVLGAGCFWCTEAVFSMFKGVLKVTPGYAGGTTRDPTYEQVCMGQTGHAEVLMVEYNPDAISLEKLLEIFFAMHDPTTKDRQGADIGNQYRSIILYNSEEQKRIITEYLPQAQKDFDRPITTQVGKLGEFFEAEDYHHNYYQNNKFAPYCMLVISPKLKKIKQEFGI